MNLLVLTHDDVTTLDRRIICVCRTFVRHGWGVRIVATTGGARSESRLLEPGIQLLAVPIERLLPVWDSRFHGHMGLAGRVEFAVRRVLAWSPRFVRRTCFALARRVRSAWRVVRSPARTVLGQIARRMPRLRRWFSGSRRAPAASQRPWYPLPFTRSFVRYGKSERANAVLACDLPALPAARVLATRWGVPLVYDSHEYYVEQVAFDSTQRSLLAWHERSCLEDVGLAITVSPEIADALTKRYGAGPAFHVLYNSPDFSEQESQVAGRARRACRIGDELALVLYHGGLIPGRNLESLVAAAPFLDGLAHVLLLGYGEAEYIEKLTVGVSGITIHEAVPQDELPGWIGDADLCVIPYGPTDECTRFALPNKLFDCVATGVPVVANEGMEAVGRVLREHRLGWLGPMRDGRSTAATIRTAVMEARARPPSQGELRAARARFGWAAQEAELCRWLRELGLEGF